MLQNLFYFILGLYVGQEFGTNIPNVKNKTCEIYKEFQKTEFYNKNFTNNK